MEMVSQNGGKFHNCENHAFCCACYHKLSILLDIVRREILVLLIKFKLGLCVHIYHPFAIDNPRRQFERKRDKKNHLQFNSTRDVEPGAALNISFHFCFSSIRVLMRKETAINVNGGFLWNDIFGVQTANL